MKTINKITLTLGLILIFGSLSAQDFKFGIQAGTNLAVQSPIGDYYNNEDIRAGLHAGVFGNYSFNENVSLQAELNYDQKGCQTKDITGKYDYLSVPVLFNYSLGKSWKTPLSFNIYAGPYASFLVNAKTEIDTEEISETIDMKDDTENTELGTIIGFGVKYPVKESSLLFNIRLGLGLTSFDKNDTDPKNKYIGLSLGYEF
jgi:outer membrane scaffolding protein for murein synthesis (MipA/OmpV family)